MPVNKNTSGTYTAEFRRNGKKYKKNFPTSKAAKAWEAKTISEIESGLVPDAFKDTRKLSELVERWHEIHGHTLTGANVYNALLRLSKELGDPTVKIFKAQSFIDYRRERLEAGTSENMVNHELTYL
jgi:hypothetical protein